MLKNLICHAANLACCLSIICSARAQEPKMHQETVVTTKADEIGWEKFPDNSTGQKLDYVSTNGVNIAGYIRKPAGAGPFAVVVLLHGGGQSVNAAYGMGRSMKHPTVDLIAAGWAVYAIDYRPSSGAPGGGPDIDPIQWVDAIMAVEKARSFPFVDPRRVAVMGGSHGGLTLARITSRVDVACGVLCAPAILDLAELTKAKESGAGKVPPKVLDLARPMEAKYGKSIVEIAQDPDRYGYSSALTEVPQVRWPILLINGRNDTACCVAVAEVYAQKLRAAGKVVETFFPDNGPHGFYFGNPREIPETAQAAQHTVAFLHKYLDAKPSK